MNKLFLLLALFCSFSAPLSAQTRRDTVLVELSRMRGFITAAQTQATKLENAYKAKPIRVDTLRVVRVDTVHDTVRVTVPAPVVVAPPSPPVVVAPPVPPSSPVVIQPVPVVTDSAGFVQYPSEAVGFILGPQLRAGLGPWPWFDENALTKGLIWATTFPERIVSADGKSLVSDAETAFNRNYYDVTLTLYGEFYRTGNPEFLTGARKRADAFVDLLKYNQTKFGGSAPRELGLGGIMLRALDGRPDLWPFITQTVRDQYQGWLGLRLDYPGIYLGVRDSGYMLIYAAWLAKVHPDPAVRAEFRQKALNAATKYYVRLQYPDGGWYWDENNLQANNATVRLAQPFMVGLLLEGMIATHQLTGDTLVAAAIPKAVAWLHTYYRGTELVPGLNGIRWRNLPYFIYPNGTWNSATTLAGGWDTNTLREARQANSTVVAAYGYAFQLTRDPKYREWGDEVFAATYGRGKGPGADQFGNLGDYQEKEYGQAYRSAGHYLVWRN